MASEADERPDRDPACGGPRVPGVDRASADPTSPDADVASVHPPFQERAGGADESSVDSAGSPDPPIDTAPPVTELPPEAEARLQALIAEQQARRAEEEQGAKARRDLWLSHHWADEYDRCAVVGGRHVCRRCLTLYPIAIAVMIASLAGLPPWPERLDVWFIWLLCIPATLDFLAEKLKNALYHPRRQVIVTALVAVALGRGLAHEVDDRWSWLFWGPVLVFGSIWFAAAVARAQRTMFEQALERSRREGDFAPADDRIADDA